MFGDDDDELFLWYGWPAKGVKPYFQPGHCQRSSLSWISYTARAGLEPAQNLSSGFVKWSCAVVITTTSRQHITTTPRRHDATTPQVLMFWYQFFCIGENQFTRNIPKLLICKYKFTQNIKKVHSKKLIYAKINSREN